MSASIASATYGSFYRYSPRTYEILFAFGAGGMGEVYHACDARVDGRGLAVMHDA